MQPQAGVGRIQPAGNPLQPEQLGVGDEPHGDIVLCRLRLHPPVPLHQLDHVPPVGLHDVVHIRPGHPQADQHLDDKLIARRRNVTGGSAKPACQLSAASLGDRKPLLRSRPVLAVRLDEAGALQALQGDVNLPHIQRPHLAGPLLELLLQPQAVLRPLAQQGQQRMPDAHRVSQSLIITVSILVILRATSLAGPAKNLRTAAGRPGPPWSPGCRAHACPPGCDGPNGLASRWRRSARSQVRRLARRAAGRRRGWPG